MSSQNGKVKKQRVKTAIRSKLTAYSATTSKRCQKLELAAAFAPQTLLPIAHFIRPVVSNFHISFTFQWTLTSVRHLGSSLSGWQFNVSHPWHSFSNRNLRLVTKWANWWYRMSGRSSTNNHCAPLIRHVNQIILCLMCHSAPHLPQRRSCVTAYSQHQPFPVDNFAPKTEIKSKLCTSNECSFTHVHYKFQSKWMHILLMRSTLLLCHLLTQFSRKIFAESVNYLHSIIGLSI